MELCTSGLQETLWCGSKAVGQPWRGLDDWRSGPTDAWCHDSWLTSRHFEASEVASICIHSFGDWLLLAWGFCFLFVRLCPFLCVLCCYFLVQQEEDDWTLFVAAATGVVHGHSCAQCAGGANCCCVMQSHDLKCRNHLIGHSILEKLSVFLFSAATTHRRDLQMKLPRSWKMETQASHSRFWRTARLFEVNACL